MKKHILFILFLFSIDTNLKVPVLTGSRANQKEAQTALDFHNKARKNVKVNSLEWSVDLAKYAQEWADYLAQDNQFKHRPNNGKYKQLYGENIFYGSGKDYKLIDACENWFEEIKFYKKGTKLSQSNWSKAGHYTQMVWSTTTKVGLGIAKAKNGKVYIVANYSPAGNMMGEKAY